MKKMILGGLAASLAVAAPAAAQEAYPVLSGEVSMELQHDWVSDSDDPDAEGHDTYTTIEPVFHLAFSERFLIEAGLTLEPVHDRDPDDDRFLDDHGLYVDTLQAIYEGDGFSVNGGKFTAPFGLAHDIVPGVFGDTFSEGYELTERLGVGGSVELPVQDAVTFDVTAALFRMDTTFLSRSAFTDRDQLDTDDGGSGNTDGLENVTLTVTARDIAAVPGLTIQGSVLRQGEGEGDDDDTFGWVIGAAYEVELDNGVTVAPMIEYARAEDAIGINEAAAIDDASQDILTAGLSLGYGPWNAALVGGTRSSEEPGSSDVDDDFFQISAGYAFENGISIDTGWMTMEEDGVDSDTFSAVIAYGLEF